MLSGRWSPAPAAVSAQAGPGAWRLCVALLPFAMLKLSLPCGCHDVCQDAFVAYLQIWRPLRMSGRHDPAPNLSICAGIGKAIAKKLASQGLNVVLVALGDSLLDSTHAELSEAYPKVQFRKVGGAAASAAAGSAAGSAVFCSATAARSLSLAPGRMRMDMARAFQSYLSAVWSAMTLAACRRARPRTCLARQLGMHQ